MTNFSLLSSCLEMESSIKNELYSDILDMSNLQSSLRSTINTGNNDSQDSDWCDLWSDDGDLCHDSTDKLDKTSEIDREWQRRHDQFHTIGYRDGLMAGKEASAQEGFNVGFRDSVYVGYNWGLVRGITSVFASLPDGLKERMVDTKEIQNKFQHLHESLQSRSTVEMLKVFHDSLSKKSEESVKNDNSSSCLAESNDLSSNDNLLENYQKELQSLIDESGLKLHLDTKE
ncbi:protein YAE1 isoform X2 [Capsicum chacoense]